MSLSIALGLLLASTAHAVDSDGDGIADNLDNCVLVPNAFEFCDTDQDGYGNVCDGDFNQDDRVNATDYNAFFKPDYQSGLGSVRGTNMDCSLTKPLNFPASGGFDMTKSDQTLWLQEFQKGLPGPSGLACAGTVPCH